MHNFEDIIERYKQELVEFSKQISVHTQVYEDDETAAVGVMAQPVQPEREEEENSPETVITGRAVFENYDDFVRSNPSNGTLRVQVFAANGSFPVPEARVRVSVRLADGERELFSGRTDVDGIVDGILLPAPDSSFSLDENSTVAPYAVYVLRVEHPRYVPALFEGIPVFDSVKSIQPVGLVPLSDSEDSVSVVPTEDEVLFGGEG